MAKVTIKVETGDDTVVQVTREHRSQWVALAECMKALVEMGRPDEGLARLADDVVERAGNHYKHSYPHGVTAP